MNRRRLLKAVGGIAAVSSVSHLTARSASATETYDFSTTVDLADHADPGDRIDSVLSDLAGNNTLIEVPDGTYQCGSVDFGSVENFGIAAKDGATPTFVAPDSLGGRWFNFDGRNVLLDGITFDHNGHPRGTINLHMTGPFVCRDVHHVGEVMASAFRLACTDSDATGLLQDCTAVDGAVQGERGRGAFVPSGNSGEVVIDGCHFENMTDNCIYCSPSNGPVRVLNCFFKNNNISNVRVSMPATVRNVVVVNDSLARTHGGGRNQRGIWLRDRGSGSVTVENCDVTHTSDDDSHPILVEGGDGDVTECRVRNDTYAAAVNPGGTYSGSGIHVSGGGDLSAPSEWVACSADGCDEPRTTAPEVDRTTDEQTTTTETDSGNETGGSTDLPNVVTVRGASEPAEYQFTVSGGLEPNTDGAGINSYDTIDGSTATGRVWSGEDSYVFGGEITDFSLSGAATVLVNGEEVDPADLGAPDLPNVVSIRGASEPAEYQFTVSGGLEPNTDGAGINDYDTIDGSTATGRVWGGEDSYVFGGEITDFSLNGAATVLVNGEEVDPSQFGAGSPPSVDRYDVVEAGSKNDDANIIATWAVSDEDGDLSTVTVDVLDDGGTVVDSKTTTVSGDAEYSVDYFAIPDVPDQTFDVQLTAVDAEGNETSASATVQE
ncbi:right-handed parallel beta-helix repeat-containing protein [Halosimplex sp. TS25]|uniref:right-handed parallel beta-helix repeat-containing protein n=1 Tax=Halosimplex rarum TaxID=3396619 RepID=UPI0039ECECAA